MRIQAGVRLPVDFRDHETEYFTRFEAFALANFGQKKLSTTGRKLIIFFMDRPEIQKQFLDFCKDSRKSSEAAAD